MLMFVHLLPPAAQHPVLQVPCMHANLLGAQTGGWGCQGLCGTWPGGLQWVPAMSRGEIICGEAGEGVTTAVLSPRGRKQVQEEGIPVPYLVPKKQNPVCRDPGLGCLSHFCAQLHGAEALCKQEFLSCLQTEPRRPPRARGSWAHTQLESYSLTQHLGWREAMSPFHR